MDLTTSLYALPGIGPNLRFRLERLNLFTVSDLINHFPFRYDDFSNVVSSLDAQIDQRVTIVGEIWSIKNIYTRSRKVLTQAIFNDGNAPILLTWFNQGWLTKQIMVGDKLQVSGKLTKYKNKLTIMAPIWEKIVNPEVPTQTTSEVSIQKGGIHTGRLVPVYPETFGLTSKWIRAKIADILPKVQDQILDPLPEEIKGGMIELKEAVKKIHFPENYQEVTLAQNRLGFDELFYIQLATQKTRIEWESKPLVDAFKIPEAKIKKFIKGLPFKLTNAQQKVIDEILNDLKKDQPMNRLVQGEVGSGKTVVAAVIIYLAYLNGFKSLYMAPTEILAFQHYSTLTKLLEPLGIKIGIYTGSKKFTKSLESRVRGQEKNNKKARLQTLATSDQPNVIIGTHALLSDKLLPENVGLIVVDEQQRFGVEQRKILREKAKIPHFLTMTATPIPRTVALTLYGDLDLSVIDELPKGRKLVKTHVVPGKKREAAYEFIAGKVKNGDQVYIITPLIEFSETMQSAKAAKVEYERLKTQIFPDLNLGLLHGRLKPKEKEQALNDFKDRVTDILVSTSVVEVGVDVSNATIMVIEGAEKFGLAQLHQLRGRVGRGEKQSFCFLFMGEENSQNKSRLKNLETTSDGLKLAELDLKIRGSGEIFGTRQSGRFELKIASLSDLTLIEKTREKARQILAIDPTLEKYPSLKLKLQSLSPGVMPD